jgi:ArsR family transcriptional regulator, lead/cadmium/zinc/bismuth-responsive transcriptional repressor
MRAAVPVPAIVEQVTGTQGFHPEDIARAQAGLERDEVYSELAELFGALADSTRARLVHALLHAELCTVDLARAIGVSESGVSQHLRILRALRLVKSRRAGKFVYHSLDDAHIALLVGVGLTHLGHGAAASSLVAPVMPPGEAR